MHNAKIAFQKFMVIHFWPQGFCEKLLLGQAFSKRTCPNFCFWREHVVQCVPWENCLRNEKIGSNQKMSFIFTKDPTVLG